MDTTWQPTIQKNEKPMYLALVRALADDITTGRLAKGFRLPPQRELADHLKIAIGTVTRAYAEAERRGLVYGDGRRGTFVGETPRKRNLLATLADSVAVGIDLSKNHPSPRLDPDLGSELRQMARSPERTSFLTYPPPSGMLSHRQAAVAWLKSLGLKTEADYVFLSGGAQHGLLSVIAAEAQPGDIIASEEYTYPGVKAVAQMLGLHHIAVPMDREGIIPDALESICKHKDIRLLYCNPSLQNPTNAVMSNERRQQIARLADRFDFCVIEDEILAPLLEERTGFIADYIPQRCYFLISISKCVAAGLRLGFIVAPSGSRQRLSDSLQTTSLGQPPLMAEIFTRWLANGTVAKTIKRRRDELTWCQEVTSDALKDYEISSHPASYHVWLKLPAPFEASDFAKEARLRGVAVAPGEIFAVDPRSSVNAVRLSLGGVRQRNHLKTGLRILSDILSGHRPQEGATV